MLICIIRILLYQYLVYKRNKILRCIKQIQIPIEYHFFLNIYSMLNHLLHTNKWILKLVSKSQNVCFFFWNKIVYVCNVPYKYFKLRIPLLFLGHSTLTYTNIFVSRKLSAPWETTDWWWRGLMPEPHEKTTDIIRKSS